MYKKTGKQSFVLPSEPRIVSSAAFVGSKEGEGPLGKRFDTVLRDDTLGLDSWEEAESRMLESAVRLALRKTERAPEDVDFFLGGDLFVGAVFDVVGDAAWDLKPVIVRRGHVLRRRRGKVGCRLGVR